jgi:hypothetical protein
MLYFYQLTGEFGISRQDACMRANTSAPEGSPVIGKFVGYQDGNPPEHNRITHVAVEVAPTIVDGTLTQQWRIDQLPQEQVVQNLARAREAAWEAIKVERDRRAGLGVKVGQHWFHSDQKSRTQQLGLVLLGANIPAGLQWKTLTLTPPPVFVPMTQQLAQAIVSATAASDTAIFTAAEVHRIAVESSTAPQNYDFSTGWPTSIEEEANAAGITFDQSLL